MTLIPMREFFASASRQGHPLVQQAIGDESDDSERDKHDHRIEPVFRNCFDCLLAEEIRDEPDGGRPENAARRR